MINQEDDSYINYYKAVVNGENFEIRSLDGEVLSLDQLISKEWMDNESK